MSIAKGAPAGAGKVAALVVSYFPDEEFTARLSRLLEQVSRVVVIDNGSDDASLAPLEPYQGRNGFSLLRNEENLGIATALNQGMRILAGEGFEWVVTLDQDSTVQPGFVQALCATRANDPNPEQIAMVGANRHDSGVNGVPHRWVRAKGGFPFFERVECRHLGTDGVTIVITSGTLTSVAVFRELGPFRDDFFIDLVDMEFCLRARRAGYRIIVSCEAQLAHQLGAKSRVSFMGIGLSPTNHSPLRRYYLFRNSVPVVAEYGAAQPHWLIYHLLALTEVVAGVILAERQKQAKLCAIAKGLWDGLRGRAGPATVRF